MDVLIVVIEAGRFGPARLPQVLSQAGLEVAALCPGDNLLAKSQFLKRQFELPPYRSLRLLARSLAQTIAECQPRFIIPGDEQVVALLHRLVRLGDASPLPKAARDLVMASLGDPAHYEAMLMKSDTLALAREIGVRVPPGGTVATGDDAVAMAETIGYPVFVKKSFSWAGQGVVRCETAAEVRAAFGQRGGLVTRLKAVVRRALGRDWFPTDTRTDVQGAINGEPVLFCALAWQGRMIGGFAGTKLELSYPNGPSAAVQICHEPKLAEVAEKMIAALGCTGFVSFDFMVDYASGKRKLIECNPRPVPVSHLGSRVGVDLPAELAALLRGAAPRQTPLLPSTHLDVLLFPHALDTSRHRPGRFADLPIGDPGLLRHITGETRAVG